MSMFQSIREFAQQCWQTSEDHGWHDGEKLALKFQEFLSKSHHADDYGLLREIQRRFFLHKGVQVMEKLMLIDTEVSEAVEDFRAIGQTPESLIKLYYLDGDKRVPMTVQAATAGKKPLGFPSEVADIIIRVCDLCVSLGVDIAFALECKAAYNKQREWRHGGKAV